MVSVITEIEVDGESIKTSDITAQDRRDWAQEITTKLESLHGVETSALSALAKHTNNQIGNIEVILSTSESLTTEHTPYFHLTASPRSISQKIRHILTNYPPVRNFEVEVTPDCEDEEKNLYQTNYYIITFALI